MISVERHACEMTMCYRSAVTTTKPEKLTQDEIVVMQQHSNGENLVVYRGFLSKGGEYFDLLNELILSFAFFG